MCKNPAIFLGFIYSIKSNSSLINFINNQISIP